MSAPADLREGRPAPDDKPPRALGYVAAFDGVRGVAVQIVLLSHLNVILPIPRILVVPGAVVPLDMFFVLSGFLITALLLREQLTSGRLDVLAFYQRRALRLFPALFAVVIAHALYAWLAGLPRDLELTSLRSILFYFANWQMAFAPKDFLGGAVFAEGLQHLWSLSVEEQFYLVWPLVVLSFIGARRRFGNVAAGLLAIIALIGLYRALLFYNGDPWSAVLTRTDTRADALLVGAFLAFVWTRRREPTQWLRPAAWGAVAILLPCLAFATVNSPFLFYGGLSLIDWSCGMILLAVLDARWAGTRLFRFSPFVRIGKVSYGLYLWHLPIYFMIRRYGTRDLWGALLALALTAACALVSWFLLEKPALRWKRQARPVVATAQPADVP